MLQRLRGGGTAVKAGTKGDGAIRAITPHILGSTQVVLREFGSPVFYSMSYLEKLIVKVKIKIKFVKGHTVHTVHIYR